MRRALPVVLLLAVVATAIPVAAQEETIFPYPYRLVELENGFKAYLIDTGPSGQLAYVTMVRTGSRDEWEPGRSGYAHFFEHMMFRGTKKHPDYGAVTTRIGAARNAFTSSDMTVYYLVVASDALETVMDLESDRFMNLDYSEADFRRQANPVLGEFTQGRANPYGFLSEKVRDTAFDEHTYKHTTIGFEADVRAMPEGYEYSRAFHKNYYRPENCVLVLAGDFNFDNAEKLVHTYYDGWEKGYTPPQITPEPAQTAPRDAQVDFAGRTVPLLSVNYKGPAWSATDRLAVATTILGQMAFGSNSEIYKRLVLQEQKLESISGGFGLQRDPYLLSITARVKNESDIDSIKQEIAATVQSFQEDLADEKLLADTKSAMKYGFLNRLETPQGTAFSLISFVINTGSVEAIEDYYKTLEAITTEDLQAAAQKYLVDSGRTTVTLLPAKGERS